MSVEYNKGSITLTGPDGPKTYESVKADYGESKLPDYTGATVVVPSTVEQVLETANTTLTTDIVVSAVTADIDSNIKAENIKKDVEILGVKGTLESSGGSLKTLLDATRSTYNLFFGYGSSNIDGLISYNDTSNVTNMRQMFYNCSSLTTIPQLDTSNVTNMSQMFYNCSSLTTIPQLDTSNVTNMVSMFSGCRRLTSIPQLDTSNVTNMNSIFVNCFYLTSIPQLDTSNVTNMYQMFHSCSRLTEIKMINIGADLDISHCTKMEREALLEVLGNLKDLTGSSSKTLTLRSTLLAKLTDEDKLIATNKNWVLE